MNLATLEVRIKDYEDAAAKAGKAAADRAALAGKLGGSDKVLKFVEAMPDPETFGKLIDKMPQTPPLDEVLAVFLPDDAAKFAGFVTQTLSGNLDALAALTGEGCGREPGNLKAFAAAFESDPKPLQDMMNEGGLGAHPGALAAMAGAMDPGRFKTLCGKFVNPTERGNLSAVLGTGGLALAPEALGALAAEDDGAMLKTLAETITDPDDQTKLGDLVTRTAFAGTEPGRPGLLKDVIKDGLGNDPARLMELHAAFGCGTGAGAADLDRLVTGFDGTDGKAGRRMATLIVAFKSRDGSLSNQQLAEKMRDPYLTSITKLTVGAGASPVAGPDALDSLREAALAAPPPAPELVGATLAARLPADEAAGLFVAGLAGPADRAAMETAALQAAGMKDMAAHLRPAAGETAPDDVTANEATVAATQAATDATKVLGGKADGGTPGEITALMALADEAIAAAALEQDPVARAAALDAAESAAKAVQGAMARAAAAAMARGGGGAVAMDAQKVLASLPAALPQAVKDAAGALAAQAKEAAAGAAACTAGAAAATEVAAAALATQKALGDPVPSDVTDAANTAADRAAAAATALVATLERAPRPVEPKLLAHAGSVAQSAQEAARGTADQAKAKAAFEAAGVLLAEITAAVRDGVQRFEALEARSSTTGKAALDKLAAAGASKGRADAALAPGTEGAILAGTTSDIEAASDAAMALTTYHAEADLDKKAQAIATAAAKDKHGDKASKVQIEQEADALKAAAEAARDDAGKAREALAKALPSADPAKFAALIVDAAAKGKAALEAGKGVVNDLARDDVFRAAQECLDAVETASKRPAFEVMRAAQAAQADLGTSGPAAQAAALAGAEADALESADKDEMQARAREIAARKDPGDVDGQVAKARIACVDATTAAEAAWDALSKIAPKPDSAAYAKAIKTLSDRLAGLMGAIPETEEDSVRDAGIAKAKACALEIAEATNTLAAHHQEAAAKAAVTKQNSDMRAAGKATDTFATARNADVVFADSAATLAAGTKMKSDAATAKIDPSVLQIPSKKKAQKNTSAQTATQPVIDATVELQGADVTVDPGDFGTKLVTLRRLADDLYTRALKAANVPIRTAALDAVIAAGQAIEVALADIDNDTAAMRGSVGDDTKAAVAAFDQSKTAMNNAAAASLDQLSESDTDVRALAGAARDRQALADLPGAGRAARLDALVATRAAAEKLSEKAKAKFDTEVAGLPAAVPADTDPMPADAQKPFQNALTVGKAAATACQGAVKAAQGVKIAAHKLYAEIDAIKNRTAEEDTARTHVDGIRTGADAAISALDARRDAIATALRDVARGAFDWANWAGTNHAGNAANADLQAVAGFGDAARLEMSFPPASEADMIRVGASLQKKPVPGPASVDVAVNGKSAEVDMAHICGRHVRENHTFEGEEAPSVSEHDLGLMLKAQTAGKKNTKEEKRIIEEAGRNKPTSLFPETMTPARAQQLATEALTQADANAGGAGSVCNLLFAKTQPPTSAAWTSAWHDDPNISVDVPPVISATVGIEFAENPGVTAPPDTKIRARMFYPNAGDKMSTPDMLVLAKALGIAR